MFSGQWGFYEFFELVLTGLIHDQKRSCSTCKTTIKHLTHEKIDKLQDLVRPISRAPYDMRL